MKIVFLGTGAANAFPEAFCKCKNCQQARLLGGPSLRKRSALLVDGELLIDLNPDIMSAAQIHGLSLTEVCCCLQTHPHADHLDLSHLLSRCPDYGVVGAPILHFYASPETLARAAETFARDLADFDLLSPAAEKYLNLKFHPLKSYIPFTQGVYRVIAFPASHAPGMGAMLYSVEANGKSVFYGTDTATLPEPTWLYFRQNQLQFDVVILDHTYGPHQTGSDHLNAIQVSEHVRRMRDEGILKPGGRAFATHIAHEGNPTHPELVEFARSLGYEVAYDGLVLEI
jgi:phosphoribosyl 1,2-cyclic phosphate phosphodiesterase